MLGGNIGAPVSTLAIIPRPPIMASGLVPCREPIGKGARPRAPENPIERNGSVRAVRCDSNELHPGREAECRSGSFGW